MIEPSRRLIVRTTSQIRLLWLLRIGAPLAFVLACVAAWLACRSGNYAMLVIDILLVGLNSAMTYIEWFVFAAPKKE